MLSRDWQCLNRGCRKVFHSYDRGNPDCPHCGCARVEWVPGGGHIATASREADRQLKSLADNYRMNNINSPSESRLNRAMPKYDAPPADGPVMTFAPGFSAPFNTQGRATCGPSANRVNFTTKVAAEKQLALSGSYPQIGRDHWAGIRKRYQA